MADSKLTTRTLDLAGKTFGRLTVIALSTNRHDHRRHWICRCSCGKIIETPTTSQLLSGKTKSCSCLQVDVNLARVTKHGQAKVGLKTPEWHAFVRARRRCQNPSHKDYSHYGGRGIEFRFKDFEEFFAELGPKPDPSYSIDRINNEGHYEKGNVRWATRIQQRHNRRRQKLVHPRYVNKRDAF